MLGAASGRASQASGYLTSLRYIVSPEGDLGSWLYWAGMPVFEVTRVRGRFEAECCELGVLISAIKLADVEKTARRTAARVKLEAVFAYKTAPDSLLQRLSRWLTPR